MTKTGQLYLLIGPIGAGKSTFAQQVLARRGAIHLDLDS